LELEKQFIHATIKAADDTKKHAFLFGEERAIITLETFV
jgi:hypothetical protein